MKKSLLLCPVCGAPLNRGDAAYRCSTGHSFDRSAAGYVHLLPANRMHAKIPGDNKEMAASRHRFLSTGAYEPLRRALIRAALEHPSPAPVVADMGCGEGYYTEGIFRSLSGAGRPSAVVGIDISKFSLKYAAKRLQEGEFAVASVFHAPLADRCADLLFNCFSPLCMEEFGRILKPGGRFVYVTPGKNHLMGLKRVLYDAPYENEEPVETYPGFRFHGQEQVDFPLTLNSAQQIADLFRMTPYYWRTPPAGMERLARLAALETPASFRVLCYEKED